MACEVKLRVFRVFCMGDAQSLYIIGRIRHLAYFILLSKEISVVPALKLESRESVVGIVNCCGLQVWGSKSGGGRRFSLLHTPPDRHWGSSSLRHSVYRFFSFGLIGRSVKFTTHSSTLSLHGMFLLDFYLYLTLGGIQTWNLFLSTSREWFFL